MSLPFRHISILGTGLIGGSFGLAVRRYLPSVVVTGYDLPDVLERALQRGAIHRGADTVAEAVRDADLVVLAAPIATNSRLLGELAPHVRPGAVVTDVGSVKAPIALEAASLLPTEVLFVGGHPMTGAENRGVSHADALLFENAAFVLCADSKAVETDARYVALVDLIEHLGGRILPMDPERHDRCAAAVSHLPQLLAVSLVNQLADPSIRDDVPLLLAAGGFRDMTRIASSPFSIWRDIIEGNSDQILAALDRFAVVFSRLRDDLEAGRIQNVAEAFGRSADLRESVPARSKGFLEPLCDVYVYTPDEPGALQRITGAVADGGVNIKDIELLKIREGTGGTFRLGLSDTVAADRAIELLLAVGYQAYRL